MNIEIFNNEQFGQIRTLVRDGEPWFIAKDICDVLEIQNVAVERFGVDDSDILKVYIPTLSNNYTLINESGLYTLVIRSNKPEAKPFRKWVTSEVLPSIRKHGAYLTPAKIEEVLLDPDAIIQLATQLKEERAKRNAVEAQVNVKDQIIRELKPKADYTDRILRSSSLVPIGVIAKDYGMSATKMNQLLRRLKIQYPQAGTWLLYAKYQESGYTHSRTVEYVDSEGIPQIKLNTQWTQKGRLFLYNKLKDNDILPVIERKQEATND